MIQLNFRGIFITMERRDGKQRARFPPFLISASLLPHVPND